MKHDRYPRVSVVMSTYNRPALLSRALTSVLAQTYDDFEVIIVDDATPDQAAMRAIADEWEPRLWERGIGSAWLRLGENSGNQCLPKNVGISEARGDYIAYLDDDNLWRAHHLTVLVNAIEYLPVNATEGPGCYSKPNFSTDMVYARRCLHIDDESLKKLPEAKPEQDIIGTPWEQGVIQLTLNGVTANFIDTSEMLHSRGGYYRMMRWQEDNMPDREARGWDTKARRFGDALLVSTWAACGNTARLVDEVTVDYYLHQGSLQMTRPSVEVPVCGSYANYRIGRDQRDPSLRLPS